MIRKLLPILGITFIDIVGFSMLIPMLPYFVTHFGASPVVVGLLMSTFSLCQLAAAPLWGYASDRIGRKMVLIVSQIGATIGWAMLGLAPNIAAALAVAPIAIVFAARIVEESRAATSASHRRTSPIWLCPKTARAPLA